MNFLNEDRIQRIKVAGIFLLQIYKVTTGTLLSLFVPQSCKNNQICTLQENLENNDTYHRIVVSWNFLSMFTFLLYYFIELRREEWAIKFLDIDNNISDNALKNIIKQEPVLDKKMDRLNLYYYKTLCVTCVVYFINMIITIKLLHDNYHSSSTISCFLSFTLLVTIKLYNSFIVANQSVKHDKMMSAYMCEFVSFNIIDKDYKNNNQTNNNNDQDLNNINLTIINP
jgi:hypothetical protein